MEYYGRAMLGDLNRHAVQISSLPLPNQNESAYAAYEMDSWNVLP